jgi:hypothetical protein
MFRHKTAFGGKVQSRKFENQVFADQRARQQVFAAYHPVSKATVQRAQGWAILFGTVLLATGLVDNPRNATIGQKTLQRVCEDSEPRDLAFG